MGKEFNWYTNNVNSIRIHKDAFVPEGYHRGRINKPGKRLKGTNRPKFSHGYKPSTKLRKPQTDEHKAKTIQNLNTGKGTIWANNGVKNVRLTLPLPDGYNKGRICRTDS